MFSTKCQVQNDRTNWEKISCFCQNLDFTLYFTIETSIFKLRPLFRFLCLINSFYRRYVSCMYNISNIYPIYIQYIQYIPYICYEKRTPGTPSHEMERSTHLSVWLMCKGNEIKIFLATPLPPSGKKSYRFLDKNGLQRIALQTLLARGSHKT